MSLFFADKTNQISGHLNIPLDACHSKKDHTVASQNVEKDQDKENTEVSNSLDAAVSSAMEIFSAVKITASTTTTTNSSVTVINQRLEEQHHSRSTQQVAKQFGGSSAEQHAKNNGGGIVKKTIAKVTAAFKHKQVNSVDLKPKSEKTNAAGDTLGLFKLFFH